MDGGSLPLGQLPLSLPQACWEILGSPELGFHTPHYSHALHTPYLGLFPGFVETGLFTSSMTLRLARAALGPAPSPHRRSQADPAAGYTGGQGPVPKGMTGV